MTVKLYIVIENIYCLKMHHNIELQNYILICFIRLQFTQVLKTHA